MSYIPRDAYEQEIIGAQQQAETARKLRESIIAPQGQMVGNQFVAPSITQHLANVLKSYMGGQGERDAAQKIKDLQAAQAQKEQAYIAGMPSPTVTPAVAARTAPVFEDSATRLAKVLAQGAQPSSIRSMTPTQDNADAMQPNAIAEALRTRPQQDAVPNQIGTQAIPAQPEKITQPGIEDYLKYAMNAPNEKTAALVQLLGVNRQNAADKQDAFKAAAELKKEQYAQQLEAQRQQREWQAAQAQIARDQNASNQQGMARLTASLRPEPMVAVMGGDGVPINVPRSQAAGMPVFNAGTQKAAQAATVKAQQNKQNEISTQQVLDQAAILFQHPGRQAGTGASSWMGNIPGTDAKGFQANLDTFKAQTFIPMVSALKGMGALTDAEGKKLSDSVGALNPSMPEKEFEQSLKTTTKLLFDKARASGLNVQLPDFAAQTNPASAHPEDITAILNQYGKPK